MATLDYRLRVHRRREIKKRRRGRLLKQFLRKVLACFVISAMVISGAKIPAAYAYFTATQQSDPVSIQIVGVKCCRADVHFLDKHLINKNKPVPAKMTLSGGDALQPLATKETIFALITLEGNFEADEIDISTVEIHHGEQTASPLTGTVRGGNLLVELERARIVSWFAGQAEMPDEVTFAVTGEGGADPLHQFVFTGSATIRLTGSYETTAVGIDGPRAQLIPKGGKAAGAAYHLVNQNGTVLDAAWSLENTAPGVAIDAGTGQMTVETTAGPGSVTIVAEFTRADGIHTVKKTISLLADPHLAVDGPGYITVGDGPQQYRIQTRDNPVLENINWRITAGTAGVTVDRNGMVTVSEGAGAGAFTLRVDAELKGIPLSAQTQVVLLEPAPLVIEEPAPEEVPEEEAPEPEVVLPEDAIFITGEDLVLIPTGETEAAVSYTAADRDGNPLRDVTWSLADTPDGVAFDAAAGVLTVTNMAPETMLTLEAESTTAYPGRKNITLAHPAPMAVRISGPENIMIPGADTPRQSFNFVAAVLDQKGNALGGKDLTWSLDGEVKGVTINSDGLLTITGEAVAGTVVIVVSAGEITGTLAIVLAEKDAQDEDPGEVIKSDDPPIREEEPEEPGDADTGDDPDKDDGPGVVPDDEDPADEAGEPSRPDDEADDPGEPGNEADDPGQPGNEADDPPGVEPGNEMTDPTDDTPGESDGAPGGESDDGAGGSGGEDTDTSTDTGTGEGAADADGSGDAGTGDNSTDSGSGESGGSDGGADSSGSDAGGSDSGGSGGSDSGGDTGGSGSDGDSGGGGE